MNKNTVSFSLITAAFLAALLLTASESHAKKPAGDTMENMDHMDHMENMDHMDHVGHGKVSPKTPQQKKASGFIKKADALCDAGQFEDSLPFYTKATEADPRSAEAFFKRGKAFYRLGSDLNALEDLSKAIEINPNYSEAYFQRGVVWFTTGDEEKMIEDLKTAARLASMDHTSHVHILKW